jgi:hypothetical protein
MYFHPANFRLPLLAGVLTAAVLSVEAQQPVTNTGQSIIFSSPDNSRSSSNPTSFSTKLSSPNFRDSFQSASPAPTFDDLSAAPPPVPGGGQQPQRLPERRKNWAFSTPAEILGVTTPEKNQKIQERDAAGQPKNPTSSQNSPGDRYNRTNNTSFNPADSGLENPRSTIFSRMNAALNDDWFSSQNADSDRSKLSGPPAPNPAQEADMDQFRQLLEPGFSPATEATLSPGRTALSQPQISPASGTTQPLVNPFGASFTPLSSGLGKPAGLQPLPGVTRQTSTQPAITPSWAPQPPPWMSQTSQPFVMPQRKF